MEKAFEREIYNHCLYINNLILDKVNSNEKLTFTEHYLFQATTFVLSLVYKNIFCTVELTYSTTFIYRCLIENLAVMAMYNAGGMPLEVDELIEDASSLLEYNNYKKFKNDPTINTAIYDFNHFKDNFEHAKEKYNEINKKYEKVKLQTVINSKLPFILDDYNFDEIVNKYLSDEIYEAYKILSVFTHPNDLVVSRAFAERYSLDKLEDLLLFAVYAEALKYKEKELIYDPDLKSMWDMVYKNPITHHYRDTVAEEANIVLKFADVIEEKVGENFTTYFFREVGNSLYSFGVETIFSLTEVIKCKVKPLLEVMALTFNMAMGSYHKNFKDYVDLFNIHTKLNLLLCCDEVNDGLLEEVYKEGYEIYRTIDSSKNYLDFKNSFKGKLGFLPEKTSYNKLVYEFINAMLGDNQELANHIKLLYGEAQMLSHANGYMAYANTAAFMEIQNIIPFIDDAIGFIMSLYVYDWDNYNKISKDNNNKFVYDLKKYYKLYIRAKKKKLDEYVKMNDILMANMKKVN